MLLDVSLWSADLTRLGDEIRRMDPFADSFHFDLADGHFTPTLLFFPDLIRALRPLTGKPFHAHLMVTHPDEWTEPLLAAGVNCIIPHLETAPALRPGFGLAIAVETPLTSIEPWLDRVALINVMATPIGIKGVDPEPVVYDKIAQLRRMTSARIMIDGGIREHTVPRFRQAGADGIVPGSLLFGSPDPAGTASWLRSL